MRSSAKNISLTSVDDLFSTEESRVDDQREKITIIPLADLHPFKDHPFKVIDNEAMADTAESIKEYGVLVPAIARSREVIVCLPKIQTKVQDKYNDLFVLLNLPPYS